MKALLMAAIVVLVFSPVTRAENAPKTEVLMRPGRSAKPLNRDSGPIHWQRIATDPRIRTSFRSRRWTFSTNTSVECGE